MTKSQMPYLLERPDFWARKRARPTAIDLFCGAGGLSLGLLNAGWDVRLASDIERSCAATHSENFPRTQFLNEDIRQVSAESLMAMAGVRKGELDLLAGGPPCQGFSILGRRNEFDPRNDLFAHFVKLAAAIQPKVILIENVPGLATLGGGAIMRQIAKLFDRAGYDADCAELVAAQYGVPQLRWRMVFIAWRRDLGRRGGFPKPTHGIAGIGDLVPNRTLPEAHAVGFLSVGDAISDLPVVAAGQQERYYSAPPECAFQEAMRHGSGSTVENHYAPKLSPQNLARIAALRPGQDWRSLPHELLPPGMQRALRKDHTRRFRRMTWEGVARSIITRFRDPKSGEYTHPSQDRTISIREAARIQSFPDWFVFRGTHTELYDQVGNAVPVLMAREIGTEILRLLRARSVPEFSPPKSRYRLSQASFDLHAA